MQVDFLNSEKWLSLVFEGRNKDYGAYVHREESSDRHLKAMLIITIVALGLIFLPKVIKSVLPPAAEKVSQTGIATLTDLTQDEVRDRVTPVEAPPPPALDLLNTTKFTSPIIAPDDKVDNEDVMMAQQALSEPDVHISIATVVGSPDGIDIATIKTITGGEEVTVKPKIPTYIEVMPMFPGGDAALMKWLHDNIVYPSIAIEQGIQGRVNLRFVVGTDGSVDQVEIVKGLDPSCDKEAVRVIKKMPKWIPGKQNGNPASVYYSLPVVFKLQNN